ncbi:type I 3-dehydroquinate dehydratase [Dactylosporangium vinaceum]|uniref:3-dehydroquinate dehydratase n=1 Tax=Dactylosporangium vinaceum TaxID=53362 RepID=A0ABV5LYK7_9ACTN|nr:type I 3-dehydroquinate dehydratase [Dactylosporangium vinaceum]UAB98248.1 type I 3-dehydroquinate dehydratase [Dactylosporangium vinaceum]
MATQTLRERLTGGAPLVAVSFGDEDPAGHAARARALGVDLAELRIDWHRSAEPADVLAAIAPFRAAGLPTLATIRSKAEGGYWSGDDAARLRLFAAVLPAVDAVDVELSSDQVLPGVVAAARAADRPVIVSYHDFDRTPGAAELRAKVEAARAAGADAVKISTMAQGSEDLRVLAGLLVEYDRMIVIGMGAEGAGSRVFFPLLGSRITYSAIGGRPAPGQLPFEETKRLLTTFSPEYAASAEAAA